MKTNLLKTLVTAAALSIAAAASAASISFEVQVPGYSTAGWIKVKPELRSVLGGKVRYMSQYGGWVTDRVSRGEYVRTTIRANKPAERYCRGSYVGIDASNGFFAFTNVILDYSNTKKVSSDPSFDNVYVWAITEAGYFEQRVPIGSR